MKNVLYIIIIQSIAFCYTVSFSIDMNDSAYPNNDYNSVVINGSWNGWQGWGVSLVDDNQDGIFEGSLELDNGTYEYVVAVTGQSDGYSGWGLVLNAPLQSMCDWNGQDQWANYGFQIQNNNIVQSYCAETCNQLCIDNGLLRPDNLSSLTTTYVPFEWSQQPNANLYNFQLSLDEEFNEIVLDTIIQHISFLDKSTLEWDNSYWWRVKPVNENNSLNWLGVNTFEILSKKYPENIASIYDSNAIQDGYVVFGGFSGTESTNLATAVIDHEGNEIWNDGYLSFIINHISKDGNLYGMSNLNWPRNTGAKINFNRDILWNNRDDMNFDGNIDYQDAVDIHEIKQIFNGNYMAFVPDYTQNGPIPEGSWDFLFRSLGYIVDGVTDEYPYIGMRLVEWDEEGNEVWSWNPYDHFNKQHTDLYGGFWYQAFDSGSYDWMHSNAFHFDENESVIYVSHRHLSRISKISYPSGEVIWNMGMPPGYGTGDDNICTDLGFSFQHHIQLMDDGTLLFFDNGNISPILLGDANPTSRVRRVRVVNDSYCETVWEYVLPPELFGAGMGSVQLLDNGNYLIYTYGNGLNQSQPTLREITANQEILWNYQGTNNAAWYRTYKIPSLYPELFSVIVDNYTVNNQVDVVEFDNDIKFTIYNNSGYNHEYRYTFLEISDNEQNLFEDVESSLIIEAFSSAELVFNANDVDYDVSMVNLAIYPVSHQYALKNLYFNVYKNDALLGDLNQDGLVNVIDIVVLVNIILGNNQNAESADINDDGLVNVIDIVVLVSEILNS